jgi:hypothetical protein
MGENAPGVPVCLRIRKIREILHPDHWASPLDGTAATMGRIDGPAVRSRHRRRMFRGANLFPGVPWRFAGWQGAAGKRSRRAKARDLNDRIQLERDESGEV